MKTSSAGLDIIRRNEGLRLDAYPDPATGGDPWTIGYGCTGPNIYEGLTITNAEADQMLSDRLAREFEPAVSKVTGRIPTTQGQFDSMVSLSFNIGVGGFLGSSVAREHAVGNYAAAAEAFLLWNRASGHVFPALTRRRGEERALYLSGGSATAPAPPGPSVPIPSAREMQTTLAALGYDPGGIDGVWGARSAAALAAYLRQK